MALSMVRCRVLYSFADTLHRVLAIQHQYQRAEFVSNV